MQNNLCKFLLPAIMLLFAACSERGQVRIEHAWISEPRSDAETPGFLEVINPGNEPVEIVSASSDAFESVTFYLRQGAQNDEQFRPVAILSVPARGRLELDGKNGRLGFAGQRQAVGDGDHMPLALAVRLHNGQLITLEAELHVHEGQSEAAHGHAHH